MNVIISDIDGTLLGDEDGLDAFNKYISSIRDRVMLIYASGRSYDEYLNAVEHEGLIYPDAVIASTGADIYVKNGNIYEKDIKWNAIIDSDGWDILKVRKLLDGLPGLASQTARNSYKASYYMGATGQNELIAVVADIIKKNGIEAKIIASHGKYLDVLPKKCDKGEAALYLAGRLNIHVQDVIVAGDSENDVDLFRKFRHGIIVGNAHHAMKQLLKGGDFYEAQNHAAAGLLEGLKHYTSKKVFKI